MQLEFFLKFPSMERESLRDLKKGIDLTFKDFSREYGDSIEGFFGPLLKFLVWFEKFLITTPWPLIIFLLSFLAWLSSRSLKLSIGTAISFFVIGYFGMWKDTMSTMAIISVATLICLILGSGLIKAITPPLLGKLCQIKKKNLLLDLDLHGHSKMKQRLGTTSTHCRQILQRSTTSTMKLRRVKLHGCRDVLNKSIGLTYSGTQGISTLHSE